LYFIAKAHAFLNVTSIILSILTCVKCQAG